jgi:hypothetical protein
MTEKEIDNALANLPRTLRDVAACLMRWSTRLEDPWRGNTSGHGHILGIVIGAMRYKAMDLDKLAHALEQRAKNE